MSQFLPETQTQEHQSAKGPEAYLSPDERKALQRSLSFPEDIPPKFKSWLIDFIAVNIPQIPISQIVGFKSLLYSRGTVFPPSPKDGQMFGYQVDANTIWQFRYDNGIADAYKWIYTGGPPLTDTQTSESSTTSTTYVDLDSGQPQVTAPKAGIFRIDHGARSHGTAATSRFASIHYGSAASDNDSIENETSSRLSLSRAIFPTITAAGQVVKQQYRVTSGDTGSFARRWLAVTPIRISG